MSTPIIPGSQHALVVGNLIEKRWHTFLQELARSAATAEQIAAIATALGSTDGTIANIPAQTVDPMEILAGAGISIMGDNPKFVALQGVINSGAGALLGITVDSFGRVTGTSAATTDDLPEGTTNLYFTDARAIAAVGAASSLLPVVTGEIASGQPVFVYADDGSLIYEGLT